MKLTKNQKKELIIWEFFIPTHCDWQPKTDKDLKMFFEWSERGKHKDVATIATYLPEGRTYFHALVWGKTWATTHARMFEKEFGTRSWPGYAYFFEDMPPEVIKFFSKEMFKGIDEEIILRLNATSPKV